MCVFTHIVSYNNRESIMLKPNASKIKPIDSQAAGAKVSSIGRNCSSEDSPLRSDAPSDQTEALCKELN